MKLLIIIFITVLITIIIAIVILILSIKYIKPQEYIDALAYWETMKKNKWEELSPEQRKKLLRACLLIDYYQRGFSDTAILENALKQQLPILTKNTWLDLKNTWLEI